MFYKIKKYVNDWNAEREFRKIAPALNKDAENLNATELIELIYGDKWKRFFGIKQIGSKIESYCRIIEKKILNLRKIDFLFIDGDHTYEGVKKDVELYTPLVADDGFIALHDIAKHPASWNVEVDKCWNEIKNNYRYEEYIENVNQGWAGIGLLYKS